MAQLKDIFKVTQSQYDTLVNGGTVGSHTYDSNAIYLVEGSGTQNITYNFAKGYDGFTVTPSEGTPQTVSVESTRLLRLDTRNKNPNPYAADNYAGYTTVHLKTNSTIGINDEGTYSALMQIYPWGDATGGSVHQLAYGTNGGIYHRYGTSTWSNWNRIATREWVTDQLDDLDVDVDLSNYVDKTTTQTITGSKTFTAVNSFTDETKFTNSQYAPTWKDVASGIGKSSCFTRGAFMQLITGQILLPNAACTNTDAGVTGGYETSANALKFQTMTASATAGQPAVTTVATIDSSGIATKSLIMTSGTTAKAAWQYNSSTDCVELVW